MIRNLLVMIFSVCVLFAGSLQAQSDTLEVPAETEGGDTYVNSLIDFVVADTNDAGEQLHKVYKLTRGKFYVLDQAVDLRNPVHLVAAEPVADDPEKTPPKILSNTTADGGTATGNLINAWADITIKNIWLGGMSLNGNTRGWGQGNALAVQDSFVTVNIDGVWLDYNGWSAISTSQPHTSWFINDLHARNEQNPGDPWTTFLLYFEGANVLDSLVVRNSTYFQSNSFFLFPPPVVQYMEIDHNAFVNILKWPFHETQWLDAKITNNIFYNVSALSLTENEEEGQDPDWLEFGLINVDTLAANESDTLDAGPYTIPEDQRIFIVRNNVYYWSSEIQDYWANNDSVKAAVWMNSRTQAMFDDDESYPNFIAENNWNQDPQFNDFPELDEATQLLADVCVSFREGSMTQWDWDSDVDTYPELYEVMYEYPLAEDFRSYSGLTGTDGNPVGDLDYYPEDMVGIEIPGSELPAEFALEQNYPNPFNPSTTIQYSVNEGGTINLAIYNLLGERVKTLVEGHVTPGQYQVTWSGTDETGSRVASGVYFYKLQRGSNTAIKKMVMMK